MKNIQAKIGAQRIYNALRDYTDIKTYMSTATYSGITYKIAGTITINDSITIDMRSAPIWIRDGRAKTAHSIAENIMHIIAYYADRYGHDAIDSINYSISLQMENAGPILKTKREYRINYNNSSIIAARI